MSKTVDERVVEMRFDNRQFEQNVSTTMSTLDKFKQKLNFRGVGKGFEEVGAAAQKVDMGGLGSGVDAVRAKFSALQVMGVTALVNLTNSAVNAGKRIASALTIDPIRSGFQEYETQMNAVQTILANTQSKGSTLDDVNKALDELNHYADLTIYNFTEMTRNIGTFTAAGIDLKTSVSAIQGIANLAAVSGSTSQQASVAMYQLSQALAAGTVKLMDWNSVVNAGMGGEIFQNALKETSKQLGTGAEAAIKAEGSFRESLTTGWLTAEVLTETLKKFTTSGANEYVAEFTGLSADAVQAALDAAEAQYGEADAVKEASKALAEKSGKNAGEIEKALQMAKTAEEAATKVKTFSQLWDVMKEAAQSGWSRTWQIIVGDFEEAKNLLTPLSDFFTEVIGKISDARNNLLEGALGKGFSELGKKFDNIMAPARAAAKTIDKVTSAAADLGDIVDKVIIGKFGNGKERFDKLTEAGQNYYRIQNKVNEKLGDSFRHSEEQIAAQDKLLGIQGETSDATAEAASETAKLTDEKKNLIKELAKMSEEQAKAKGYTDEQVAALKELRETADKLGMPLDEFIDQMDEINGRWLLINSFKNIGQGLVAVIKAISGAWKEVFPPMQSEQLFNIIAGFHKLTTAMKVSDETADKIKRTFKGVFAALDIILTVIGGPIKLAFKLLNQVLESFDMNLLDVTAGIGDAIVKFRDWVDSVVDFEGLFKKIIPHLADFRKKMGEIFDSIKGSEMFTKLADSVGKLVDLFKQLFKVDVGSIEFKKIAGQIRDTLFSIPKEMFEIGQNIVRGIQNGIGDEAKAVLNKIRDVGLKIIETIKTILGIHSPSTVMYEIGSNIIAGLVNGITAGIQFVIDTVALIGKSIVGIFQGVDFSEIVTPIAEGFDSLKNALGKFDWRKLLTIIPIGVTLVVLKQVYDLTKVFAEGIHSINGVIDGLAAIEANFSKVLSAYATNLKAEAIQKIAISIAILVGSVIALTFVDPKKLYNAVIILGILAGILVGLAFAMDKMSSASATIGKNGLQLGGLRTGLIAMGGALTLLALTVRLIGKMNPQEAKQGFIGLAGMIIALVAVFAAYGLLVKADAGGNMDKAGTMLMGMSVSLLILVGVAKLVSGMTWPELGKAAAFVAGFTVFAAALIFVGSFAGGGIAKVGSMLVKMSIAMGLMVGVCKLVNTLSPEEMQKGAAFAAGFLVFIGLLVAVTKISGGKQIAKIGALLLSISVSLMLMVAVCKLANKLSTEEMLKGAAFVAGFMVFVKLLVMITQIGSDKQMAKVAATLVAMSIAVAILAGVAVLLSLLDPQALFNGVAAVTVLGIVMALMVAATKGAEKCVGNVIALSIAVAVMAGAVAVLSFLDTEKLAAATLALMIILGMFALVIKMAGNMSSVTGTLLAMSVAIGILGGILYLLSGMPAESSIGAAIALSVAMLAFSGAMRIISGMKGPSGMALAAMVVMALVVAALGGVLYLLQGLDPVQGIATVGVISAFLAALLLAVAAMQFIQAPSILGLAALAVVTVVVGALAGILYLLQGLDPTQGIAMVGVISAFLAALLVAVFAMQFLQVPSVLGLAALAIVTILVGALAGILYLLQGLDPTQALQMVGVLSVFLLAMEGICLTAALVGAAAGLAIPGLAIMVGFIAVLGLVVLGLAELAMDVIAGMPKLGSDLAAFMTNIQPFINGIQNIPDDISDKIGKLSSAILKLTGTEILDAIASFFSGGSTLADLGTELKTFGDGMSSFSSSIAHIDSAVASMSKLKDIQGAIADVDLSALSGISEDLQGYSSKVSSLNTAAINVSILIALKLANLATTLSGVDYSGVTNFDVVPLGVALGAYSARVSGINQSAVVASISAANRLRDFINSLVHLDSSGIANFRLAVSQLGTVSVGEVIKAFTEGGRQLYAAGADLLNSAVRGMRSVQGTINKTAAEIAELIRKTFADKKTSFSNAGKDLMGALSTGMILNRGIVSTTAKAIALSITAAIRLKYGDFYDAGEYVVDGFAAGISDSTFKAESKAAAMAQAALDAAKAVLDINSPSKETAKIGGYFGQGFVNELAKYSGVAYKAGSGIASSAKEGLTNAIGKIKRIVDSDIDAQPVIRPVLDLSEVESGAARIGGLLNVGSSTNIGGNLTAIRTMASQELQNRDRSREIVSAINELRQNVNALERPSYTINGITYDSGSEVSEAIQTLVRAAKIERRV